jgi:hypothetical protein
MEIFCKGTLPDFLSSIMGFPLKQQRDKIQKSPFRDFGQIVWSVKAGSGSEINSVFQAVMLVPLAIAFGGGTG